MQDKKNTDEMVGEALREAGTLLLVFAPLYEIFEAVPHKWTMLLALCAVGILLLCEGIQLERKRHD